MNSHNSSQQSIAPIAEIETAPGAYLFVPFVEINGGEPFSKDDNILAAAAVRLSVEMVSIEGDEAPIQQVVPVCSDSLSIASKNEDASIELLRGYDQAQADIRENPLSEGLEAFKLQSLAENGIEFARNDNWILGGLAVRETEAGYQSGIYIDRGFRSYTSSMAHRIKSLGRHTKKFCDLSIIDKALPNSADTAPIFEISKQVIMRAVSEGLPLERQFLQDALRIPDPYGRNESASHNQNSGQHDRPLKAV